MKRTLLSFKVIILLLSVISAISYVAYLTNKQAQKVKQEVQIISLPQEEKYIVNELLQHVLSLDNLQRNPILADKDSSQMKIAQLSNQIDTNLNILKNWFEQVPDQLHKIHKVDSLLQLQHLLVNDYHNLTKEYVKSDSVQLQIDRLNDFLKESYLKSDANLFKEQRSISATSIEDTLIDAEEVKTTFWDRLIGRKKETAVKEVQHFILEQMKMSVDTMQLMQDDSIISAFTREINSIQLNRKQTLNELNTKKILLDQSNADLVNELVKTLHQIEEDNNSSIATRNQQTILSIDHSLNYLSLLLLFFIIVILILGIWIFFDINKANKYKDLLEVARDQAEEDALFKQQFLSNMSHELRTPLQSIIGYSELQVNEQPSDASVAIHSASKHLLGVVNQVLDFNRLLSGHFLLHATLFNLHDLLNEVKALIAIQAHNKKLTFNWVVPQEPDLILVGDALRIKQIMINLLQNAIKFTNSGSVSFMVKIEQDLEHKRLAFSVKDTGLGIKTAELHTIFNAFEQATNHHYTTGSGLGLSIVKQLVDLMNGTISVQSTIGEGSTFEVSIPLLASTAEHQTNNLLSYVHDQPVKRLIIIDDDVLITSYCDQLLQKTAISYTIFNDPEAFLAAHPSEDVDLILMDIRMPKIKGYDLIKLSKKHFPNGAKYVAFTAQVMPDELKIIEESGFDGILQKPFLQKRFYELLGYQQLLQNDEKADAALLKQLLSKDVKLIETGLQKGDISSLADLFHTNASRLGQFNYPELAQELRKIEIKLKQGVLPMKGISNAITSIYELLDEI